MCIQSVDNPDMAKARSTSGVAERKAAFGDERSSPGPKGSINLRIEAQTRRLIDDAAAVLGKTRTEFMIDSARAQAIDVLLDQRLFVLDSGRYDAFVRAMDNAREPGPRLRALLRRTPAWGA
jgi:uncharacterized protein (DUF1778 family)